MPGQPTDWEILPRGCAGRVSLNPIVHIDPIGTILLPLVAAITGAAAASAGRSPCRSERAACELRAVTSW